MKKSVRRISVRPLTAVLVVAATTLAGGAGSLALADTADIAPAMKAAAVAAPALPGSSTIGAGSLADMVEMVGQSVVQIEAVGAEPRSGLGSLSGHGGNPQQPSRRALGSGFIVDSSGLLITNNHVVDGASQVRVTLSDGREFAGQVLGSDPKTDLAVIRIQGSASFKPVTWGDSDRIRVGESVFAVGSPFGLGNSVTAGIVSARGREIGAGPYDDFLQVDAAINSGNSGGPLFDANGRVVGVNTAMFSPSGGNVGIGFAIPARIARQVAQQIAGHGEVSRGRIGVVLQELTPEMAAALGLNVADGALIADVEPNGPAARSGLMRGDVVREAAGRKVRGSREFARLVADAKPGSAFPVVVFRNGRGVGLEIGVEKDVRG